MDQTERNHDYDDDDDDDHTIIVYHEEVAVPLGGRQLMDVPSQSQTQRSIATLSSQMEHQPATPIRISHSVPRHKRKRQRRDLEQRMVQYIHENRSPLSLSPISPHADDRYGMANTTTHPFADLERFLDDEIEHDQLDHEKHDYANESKPALTSTNCNVPLRTATVPDTKSHHPRNSSVNFRGNTSDVRGTEKNNIANGRSTSLGSGTTSHQHLLGKSPLPPQDSPVERVPKRRSSSAYPNWLLQQTHHHNAQKQSASIPNKPEHETRARSNRAQAGTTPHRTVPSSTASAGSAQSVIPQTSSIVGTRHVFEKTASVVNSTMDQHCEGSN